MTEVIMAEVIMAEVIMAEVIMTRLAVDGFLDGASGYKGTGPAAAPPALTAIAARPGRKRSRLGDHTLRLCASMCC